MSDNIQQQGNTRSIESKPIKIGNDYFSKEAIKNSTRDTRVLSEYAKKYGYTKAEDINQFLKYADDLARGIADGTYTVLDDFKTIESDKGFGLGKGSDIYKKFRTIRKEKDKVDSRKEAKQWRKEKELRNLAMNYILQRGLAQKNTPTYTPGTNIYEALASEYLSDLTNESSWIGKDNWDTVTKNRPTTNRSHTMKQYLQAMKDGVLSGKFDSSDYSYDNELADWENSRSNLIKEIDEAIAALSDGYDPKDPASLFTKLVGNNWGNLMTTSEYFSTDQEKQKAYDEQVKKDVEKAEKALEEQAKVEAGKKKEEGILKKSSQNPFNLLYDFGGITDTIPELIANSTFTEDQISSLAQQINDLFSADGAYTYNEKSPIAYKFNNPDTNTLNYLSGNIWNNRVLRDLSDYVGGLDGTRLISATAKGEDPKYYIIKNTGEVKPVTISFDNTNKKIILQNSSGLQSLLDYNPVGQTQAFTPLLKYTFEDNINPLALLKDLYEGDYTQYQVEDALNHIYNNINKGYGDFVTINDGTIKDTNGKDVQKRTYIIKNPNTGSTKEYVKIGQLGLKIKKAENDKQPTVEEVKQTNPSKETYLSFNKEENLKEQWNKEKVFTKSDSVRLASATTDLVSAVGGFIPGLNVASAVTGAASSLGEFGADMADIANDRSGAQGFWGSLGELGLNLGMDLVSLIPAGKSVKAMKSLKTVAKYVPRIAMAVQAGQIVLDDSAREDMMTTLKKVGSLDLGKLNTQDLRNLTFLTRAVLGGVNDVYKTKGSKPQKTNKYEVSGRVKTDDGWESITAKVSKDEFSTFSKNKDAAKKALVTEANKTMPKKNDKGEVVKFTEDDVEVNTTLFGKAKTTDVKTEGSYVYTPKHIFNSEKGVWFDDANLAKNYNFASKILTGKGLPKKVEEEAKPKPKPNEIRGYLPAHTPEKIKEINDITDFLTIPYKAGKFNNSADNVAGYLPAGGRHFLPGHVDKRYKLSETTASKKEELKASKEKKVLVTPSKYAELKDKQRKQLQANTEKQLTKFKEDLSNPAKSKESKNKLLQIVDSKADLLSRRVGARKHLSESELKDKLKVLEQYRRELRNKNSFKGNKGARKLLEYYEKIYNFKKGGCVKKKVLKGSDGIPLDLNKTIQDNIAGEDNFGVSTMPFKGDEVVNVKSNSNEGTGNMSVSDQLALLQENRKNTIRNNFVNTTNKLMGTPLLKGLELVTSLITNKRATDKLKEIKAHKVVPFQYAPTKVLGDVNAINTARDKARELKSMVNQNLTSDSRLNTATNLEVANKSREYLKAGEDQYRNMYNTTLAKSNEIANKNRELRIAAANQNDLAQKQLEATHKQLDAQNISNTGSNFKNLFTEQRSKLNQADAYLREFEMKKIDNEASQMYDTWLYGSEGNRGMINQIISNYGDKVKNQIANYDSLSNEDKLKEILSKSTEAKAFYDAEALKQQNTIYDWKGNKVKSLFIKSGGKISDKVKMEIATLAETSKTFRKQMDHQHKERLLASKQIQRMLEKALS